MLGIKYKDRETATYTATRGKKVLEYKTLDALTKWCQKYNGKIIKTKVCDMIRTGKKFHGYSIQRQDALRREPL